MPIYEFGTLEEWQTFIDQATAAGIRPTIRDGFRVELPMEFSAEGVQASEESTTESDASEEPARNASRDEWADYARSKGLDPGDMSRGDIITLIEGK
jgi:hypothetical protein